MIALALVFFGARYGGPLYQTLALLVFAYVVRFFPQALAGVGSALHTVSPRLEEAARGLGLGPWRTLASGDCSARALRPRRRGGARVPQRHEGAARDAPAAPDRVRHAGDRDLEVHAARRLFPRGPGRAAADRGLGAVRLRAGDAARVAVLGARQGAETTISAMAHGHSVDEYLETIYFLAFPIGEYHPQTSGSPTLAARVAEMLGVSRAVGRERC